MSFTIDSAITLAESWFEETLDDAKCLIWGTEFLQRVVNDKLWAEDTETFDDKIADTWYSLPSDFVRFVGLEDSNEDIYTSYEIKNGKIRFADDGDYTLTYIPYPVDLATISTAVPLPDAFKYPLAEYLIFRYFKVELDDDDSYNASTEYEFRYKKSLKDIYDKMDIDSELDSFQVNMRW